MCDLLDVPDCEEEIAYLRVDPSAQSPNSWGELLESSLNNSGIRGEVSHSFDIAYGDDPDKGRVLPVHYPLAYEKLASYDFDPNSIFLFAVELLKKQRN